MACSSAKSTDFSEQRITSILKVEERVSQGRSHLSSYCWSYSSTLKMEAIRFSDTSVDFTNCSALQLKRWYSSSYTVSKLYVFPHLTPTDGCVAIVSGRYTVVARWRDLTRLTQEYDQDVWDLQISVFKNRRNFCAGCRVVTLKTA
jgi:hypothetical protein